MEAVKVQTLLNRYKKFARCGEEDIEAIFDAD